MIDPLWLLLGLALPFALGAAGALVPARSAGWAVAMLLALAVGYWARSGLPRLPPNQAHQWLVLVGVPAAALGAVLTARWRGRPGGGWEPWAVRGAVALVLPPLLMQAYLRHHWAWPGEAMAWLAGLCGVLLLSWWLVLRARHVGGGRAMAMVLALTAGATAIVTLLCHSLTQAQWSLTLAAALFGGGLVVMALRLRHGNTAAVDVALPVTLAMVLLGRIYAPGMTDLHAGLLAAAPVAAAVAHWPGGRWLLGMGSWRLEVVRLAAASVPAMMAVVLSGVQWLATG